LCLDSRTWCDIGLNGSVGRSLAVDNRLALVVVHCAADRPAADTAIEFDSLRTREGTG